MSPESPPTELSVEREVLGADGAPRRVRLTARIPSPAGTDGEPALRLGEELKTLSRQVDEAIAAAGWVPSTPPRGERGLEELVETYRPRQPELLDLLRAEGELTLSEYDRLKAHLAGTLPVSVAVPTPGSVEPPVTDRPLAALPLANDRTPTTPRPVVELLSQYRIESLKQAGAVRARRQISYEEYMALKRHFAGEATPGTGPTVA